MPDQKAAPVKPKKKGYQRLLIAIAIILILIIIALALYFKAELSTVSGLTNNSTHGNVLISGFLSKQSLLSYSNGTLLIPYALLSYNESNAGYVYADVAYYNYPPPKTIYVLDSSGQCSGCQNVTGVISTLNSTLQSYSILNSTNKLQIVEPQNVAGIKNNSVLVILDGLMPQFMLNQSGGQTLLQNLFNRGTSVIYIGQNFSRVIASQSVIVPNGAQLYPTLPINQSYAGPQALFYFNKTTFSFIYGRTYGPVSYINSGSGALIVFSNNLKAWKTAQQAGADIATVIQKLFWIPKYAEGATFQIPPSTGSSYRSNIGVFLNQTLIGYSQFVVGLLNRQYGKVTLIATNVQPFNPSQRIAPSSGTKFKTIYFTPQLQQPGLISVPPAIVSQQPFTGSFTIFTSQSEQIEPHIDIYTKDYVFLQSTPPFFTKTITSNYQFFKQMQLGLGPGSYIVQLDGFQNQNYGSAFFAVAPISFSLSASDLQNETFTFTVSSQGQLLTNITANITLNGQYSQAVNITNGTFTYSYPRGVSLPTGNLAFNIQMLGQNFPFVTLYKPVVVNINQQYIEFIVAIIIVLLEVTLVKARPIDEFYIDVPNMPEPQKLPIKIKSSEIIAVFDKLNNYYHWRYMPISRSEFRFGVANNIRANSMPVTLTYNNIELILNEFVAKGLLIGIDGLYAPKTWIEQSHHDIEYLAIFKKLRVFLVSHTYIFTDLDKSDVADIVATIRNEKVHIIIYSETSRFNKIPVHKDTKTYIAFLNADRMEEFKRNLYNSTATDAEELKLYISVGKVKLLDSDAPDLALA